MAAPSDIPNHTSMKRVMRLAWRRRCRKCIRFIVGITTERQHVAVKPRRFNQALVTTACSWAVAIAYAVFFCGSSTEAIATTMRPTAAQSCQCKVSFSHTAPLITPTMGISITLKVEATGGKERAR